MPKHTPSLAQEIEALRVLSTFASQPISTRAATIKFLVEDVGYSVTHLGRLSGFDHCYLHLFLRIAEAEPEVKEALDTDRLSIKAFKFWFLITPSMYGPGARRALIPRQDQLNLLRVFQPRHKNSLYRTCTPSEERLSELTARIARLEREKERVRVLGPYEAKNRGWRLVSYDATGSRKDLRFKTRELAEVAKAQLLTASLAPAPASPDLASAPVADTPPAQQPSGPTRRSPRSPRPRSSRSSERR